MKRVVLVKVLVLRVICELSSIIMVLELENIFNVWNLDVIVILSVVCNKSRRDKFVIYMIGKDLFFYFM